MKPVISRVSQITPDQSVVCIISRDEIPEFLQLSGTEKEYARQQVLAGEEYVLINSYFKTTYIVRTRKSLYEFRIKEELRKTASNLSKLIKANNHDELVITSDQGLAGTTEAFTEGLVLTFYSFDKYITRNDPDDKKSYPSKLLLYGEISDDDFRWLDEITNAVCLARDLINEPVNRLNAPALSDEIRNIGTKAGFRVDVFNKGKIEALKMGGLLAVNRGSVDPPVFCILEWKPENAVNSRPVVLVGKGIVYDTGGLNIKTGDYMDNMKADMAGAAAVTGTLYTIARTHIPVYVVGLIPATDNRPGGNAYTQGDILTMYNKMTVEVGNTDAEGRLILADAISYASKYNPELIINIATLTGSAAMTFGNEAIAVMGNAGREYFRLLEESGNDVYERIAELPFWDEYGEMIKSDIADIKNIGGREAGAITAGKFLEKFSEHPFIHLDIAGPGSLKKDDFYRRKTGPGTGLRLLATFLRKYTAGYNERNKAY
ncbi:MAG: leucyl aminopeptidase family protein [Bacteroidales bacterium]|nr:leucyl aminopeptidase family protein [Bacteroidales bacterium]